MDSKNIEKNMNQKSEVPDLEFPKPEAPEEFSVIGINGGRLENEEEIKVPEETTIFEGAVETGGTVIQFEKNEDGDGGRPKGLTFGLRDNPPLSIIIVYAIQVGIPLPLRLNLCRGNGSGSQGACYSKS